MYCKKQQYKGIKIEKNTTSMNPSLLIRFLLLS